MFRAYTYWEERKHPEMVNELIRKYITTKLEPECSKVTREGMNTCLTKSKSPLSINKLVDVGCELAHIGQCSRDCYEVYGCMSPDYGCVLCDNCDKNIYDFICTNLPKYMEQYDGTYLSTQNMMVNRESTPYRTLPYKLKDKITEDQFRPTANNTEIINLKIDNLVANYNIEILFQQVHALKSTSK